ncbi:MAG: glycosyltransferase family 2 protein [Sphingobacteriales bacterium]|nr:MAG: glycosyltransferase family 2 protein [Sphingobacteriales bacterium]
MKPKLSVCIISNMTDDRLYQVIDSFKHPSFEICVGFNGTAPGKINAFHQTAGAVKVFDLAWEGYGATKNKLALKATADWILSIDSDEIADTALIKSLTQLDLEFNKVYAVRRVQKIGAHKIRFGSFGAPEWKIRLYHKQKVFWDLEKVHEDLEIPAEISVERLTGTLWHLTAENLAEVKTKNDHYARLSAENMLQRGKKAGILKPGLSAFMAFMKQYFFKKGLLDGTIGWQLAQESARYTYLKYSNLRKMQSSGL